MALLEAGMKRLNQICIIILISRGLIVNQKLDRQKVREEGISPDQFEIFLQGRRDALTQGMFGNFKRMASISKDDFLDAILERAYKTGFYDLSRDELGMIMNGHKSPPAKQREVVNCGELLQICECFGEALAVTMNDIGASAESLSRESDVKSGTIVKYLRSIEAPGDKITKQLARALYLEEGRDLRRFLFLAQQDHQRIKSGKGEMPKPRKLEAIYALLGVEIDLQAEEHEKEISGPMTASLVTAEMPEEKPSVPAIVSAAEAEVRTDEIIASVSEPLPPTLEQSSVDHLQSELPLPPAEVTLSCTRDDPCASTEINDQKIVRTIEPNTPDASPWVRLLPPPRIVRKKDISLDPECEHHPTAIVAEASGSKPEESADQEQKLVSPNDDVPQEEGGGMEVQEQEMKVKITFGELWRHAKGQRSTAEIAKQTGYSYANVDLIMTDKVGVMARERAMGRVLALVSVSDELKDLLHAAINEGHVIVSEEKAAEIREAIRRDKEVLQATRSKKGGKSVSAKPPKDAKSKRDLVPKVKAKSNGDGKQLAKFLEMCRRVASQEIVAIADLLGIAKEKIERIEEGEIPEFTTLVPLLDAYQADDTQIEIAAKLFTDCIPAPICISIEVRPGDPQSFLVAYEQLLP